MAVANMAAQHKYRSATNSVVVRYDALETCLGKVAKVAGMSGASAAMPRIRCGLAGGEWAVVGGIIEAALLSWME